VTRPDGTFDPENSNLIKALEGRAPFGKDLVPPPAGAIFPRMPLGYPPVPADRIREIRDWIQFGCPENSVDDSTWVDEGAGGPLPPEEYLGFWRDFDDWAMFHATPQTEQDISTFFAIADLWLSLAGGSVPESQWVAALAQSDVSKAVTRLAIQQRATVVLHFGRPVPLGTLADCFERFGDDSLPDDPQRPVDPRHNMNGEVMWFFWSAFIDACCRLSATAAEVPITFWNGMARMVLIGLLNDGLFRGRFPVTGFTPDPQGKNSIRQHALAIPISDLTAELMLRCREGKFPP